jgi:hypothetical protein
VARVLDAVPLARLLVSPLREDDAIALMRRLTGLGIDAARIARVPFDAAARQARYAHRRSCARHAALQRRRHQCRGARRGVPVVTRMGARHAERVTASILLHAGLRELVADSDEGFVDLAIRVATDPAWRASLRGAVRDAFSDPNRSDPARYAASLERACLRALGEPPRVTA